MTEKTRAILVGCGGITGAWLDACAAMKDLEIVGLADLEESRARERAEQFKLENAEIASGVEALLERTKPDVVFDCTLPEAHVDVTLAALEAGCHVLGEKPLADTMENAQLMVGAAREAGKLYAVVQNRRYDPRIRRLKAFLAGGAIGPITTVNCDFYIAPHFGGFRDEMDHVLLLDMAIHTFDAARFLSAADPVSVLCREWNPRGSWYQHGASAAAVFEMSGDVIYNYRGSWCAEGLSTTWESDWRIIGENGTVKWDGADKFEAQVVAERGEFFSKHEDLELPEHDAGEKVEGHSGVIREFLNCVRDGGTPETVCSDNIKSLAMVFGAIESAEQGKPVDIEF